jgi:hypothetical protein
MAVLWVDKDRRRRRGLGRAASSLARGMLGDVRCMYTGEDDDRNDGDSDDEDGGCNREGEGRALTTLVHCGVLQ